MQTCNQKFLHVLHFTQLRILPLQFKINRVLEALDCFRGLEELSIPASEYCMLEPS